MCPAKREARTKRCRQEQPEAKKKEGGPWSDGVLECWSVGVLECWSVGGLECWSVGVLEGWSVG
jgi:hypothetical protein